MAIDVNEVLAGVLDESSGRGPDSAGAPPQEPTPLGALGLDCAVSVDGLERTFLARRATRSFGGSSVDRDAIAEITRAVDRSDEAIWRRQRRRGLHVGVVTLALNVLGLERGGIYTTACSGGPHRLEPTGALGADASQAVLQLEFTAAPAIMTVVGPLAAAIEADGAHGHRLLLARGGGAAQTAWLRAIELGLVGTVFAGILPSALRELGGIDGRQQLALLALAIGHPVCYDAGITPSTTPTDRSGERETRAAPGSSESADGEAFESSNARASSVRS